MKTSADIIDAINRLEHSFPIAAWRAGDADLWPSYRFRLYDAAIVNLLATQAPPSPLGRWRRLTERASRALWRVPRAAWRDRAANACVRPGNSAIFLSDGVSFLRMADTWFDRVVDPVIQALEARGLRSLKLTPLAEAHVPRRHPSWFIQPSIDRIKLFASLRRPKLDLPGFDALAAAAVTDFGALVPTRDWLRTQAARLEALAGWFGAIIRRSGASAAFVNTWYSLEGQAFVLAARRLGLRTIDLQHGLQGEQHVAYARWCAMPTAGYSTLPDECWVWSSREADAIESWSRHTHRHRARVTGNFWLQHWRQDTDPLVNAYLEQARALRHDAPTHVLICLTWGVAAEETDKLMEAARACDRSVRFWWRLHPVEAARRGELIARLAHFGLDSKRVDSATDLPLYALLRCVDMTISHSSTVTQEAAEFGIPSIVSSDYGAGLFSELIQQGKVVHATTPAAIAAAVMVLASRQRHAESAAEDAAHSLAAAVEDLLRQDSPIRLQEAA